MYLWVQCERGSYWVECIWALIGFSVDGLLLGSLWMGSYWVECIWALIGFSVDGLLLGSVWMGSYWVQFY